MDEPDLQGCEEGLRDGVVQAGARPPHGAGDAGLSQQDLESPGGVGANADAQFPGNMAHGNAHGPCQWDGLVAELREDGATYGRMIGVGRSMVPASGVPGRSLAATPPPGAGAGTGRLRRRAMVSSFPPSVTGALAAVLSLGARPQAWSPVARSQLTTVNGYP